MFLFALLLCAALIALWLFSFISPRFYFLLLLLLESPCVSLGLCLCLCLFTASCVATLDFRSRAEIMSSMRRHKHRVAFPKSLHPRPSHSTPAPQLALLKYLTISPGKLYVNSITGFCIRTSSKLENLIQRKSKLILKSNLYVNPNWEFVYLGLINRYSKLAIQYL